MGQNDVLLCFVETVDLVHEEDGVLPTQREPLTGGLHSLAQVGDTGGHR